MFLIYNTVLLITKATEWGFYMYSHYSKYGAQKKKQQCQSFKWRIPRLELQQ